MLRVDDSSSPDIKWGNDTIMGLENEPAVKALEASPREYVIADLSKGFYGGSGIVIDWDFVDTEELRRLLIVEAIRTEKELYIYYHTGGQ